MCIRSRCFAFALLFAILLPTSGAAQDVPDYQWSGTISLGGELRLFTVRGDIEVAVVSGDVARIVGQAGRDPGADHHIRYEFIERGSVIVLCAVTEGQGHRSRCGEGGFSMM